MADPTLSVSSENVCFIIVKAREFDVQDVETDPDSGSNASDEKMASVLEAHPDDPTQRELVEFITALSDEEQIDLVALMWLGAATAPWKTGSICVTRPNGSTTTAPPRTCSASRCLPIISRKASRSSDFRVRNSKSIVSEGRSQ